MSGTGCLCRATSGQGAWSPWQMQQHMAPPHPPEDKKVHPKPAGGVQMSRMRGSTGCWGSRLPGLEPVKGFSCKTRTRPSSHMGYLWPHFAFRSDGEVCALLLPFRRYFCLLLLPSYPFGAALLGKHQSRSSWHNCQAKPRGAGGRAPRPRAPAALPLLLHRSAPRSSPAAKARGSSSGWPGLVLLGESLSPASSGT